MKETQLLAFFVSASRRRLASDLYAPRLMQVLKLLFWLTTSDSAVNFEQLRAFAYNFRNHPFVYFLRIEKRNQYINVFQFHEKNRWFEGCF